MEKIFASLLEEVEQGRDCLLAAVTASSGSAPRAAGAYMSIGLQGRLQGTIGGGSLEYNAILKGQQALKEKKTDNFTYDYVLTMEGSAELGMICGGSCTVLFCRFEGGSEAACRLLRQAAAAAASGEPYWLLLPLDGGLPQLRGRCALTGRRGMLDENGCRFYAEQFGYDGRVYIFGGGHLAQELVPVLARLDFRCVVLDDRPEFAVPRLFPGAERVLLADFSQLGKTVRLRASDYAAVMTRGHLHDAEAERFLLNTPAGYIGVVGSRRKAALTRQMLKEEGYSEEQLDRVITPIGLDIGSETPAEIAVSIAAQLIQERNKRYGIL